MDLKNGLSAPPARKREEKSETLLSPLENVAPLSQRLMSLRSKKWGQKNRRKELDEGSVIAAKLWPSRSRASIKTLFFGTAGITWIKTIFLTPFFDLSGFSDLPFGLLQLPNHLVGQFKFILQKLFNPITKPLYLCARQSGDSGFDFLNRAHPSHNTRTPPM
jgi:hypothetical protein